MKIKITGRDLKLLWSLEDFGLLSTGQLIRLHFNGIDRSTVLRRLRKLKKKKLISRFSGLDSGEFIWGLDQKGGEILGTRFSVRKVNRNVLGHDIIANELRLSLEGIGVGDKWRSSHYMRYKNSSETLPSKRAQESIPDWLVSIKTQQKTQKIAAIEYEQSLKSKKRIDQTLRRYEEKGVVKLLWYIFSNHKFGRVYGERVKKVFSEIHPH